MKKIITVLALISILVIGLFTMTGCGEEETTKSKKKSSDKDQTSQVTDKDKDDKDSKNDKDSKDDKDNKDDDKKTKTVDKTPINLEDSSAYYFIVNGVKYTAGDKISKLVDNGFTQSKTGAEKEIPANGYLIGGGAILNSDKKTVFDVTPVNTTSGKIKGAEGQIGSFSIDQYEAEKLKGGFEIFGGITLGTSIEDIEAIFGQPTSKTDATEYAGPTYTYNAKASYRSFTFRFDKDGKLNSLRWQNYTFNK